MRDSENCKACVHCKPCKRLVQGKWIWMNICTLFLDYLEEDDKDGWAVYLEKPETGLCECFEPEEDESFLKRKE